MNDHNREMIWVDSHCHLNLLELKEGENLSLVIDRAKQNGVRYFLNVCVTTSQASQIIETTMPFQEVFASVGLHPAEIHETVDENQLLTLGAHPKVVAIGETGLDYFHCKDQPEWQRDRFILHIAVAKQLKKPLIIHTRDAKADTIHFMKTENANEIGGVMHCFTEDWDMAKAALDLGFYISFSGIVTFKNATLIQEVAKRMPLDRLLIETDAPYLAPVPNRGKPNFPEYVKYTGEYIAALRGISPFELAEKTTNNFFNLFQGAARV